MWDTVDWCTLEAISECLTLCANLAKHFEESVDCKFLHEMDLKILEYTFSNNFYTRTPGHNQLKLLEEN